ncbi:MAG: hypothetical protein QOH72_2282 [Solirubrobacteraceae bacterium]|nr:hypothetical protein [Solirubrobacteraceae bacterium]
MPIPRLGRTATATLLTGVLLAAGGVPVAPLAVTPAGAQVQATPRAGSGSGGDTSLEQAAQKAGDTGRTVAISLLGLAFAIAAVILVFKRDFKEAAAIFGVGLLGVLLATPAGLNMLNDLVATLFGAR